MSSVSTWKSNRLMPKLKPRAQATAEQRAQHAGGPQVMDNPAQVSQDGTVFGDNTKPATYKQVPFMPSAGKRATAPGGPQILGQGMRKSSSDGSASGRKSSGCSGSNTSAVVTGASIKAKFIKKPNMRSFY